MNVKLLSTVLTRQRTANMRIPCSISKRVICFSNIHNASSVDFVRGDTAQTLLLNIFPCAANSESVRFECGNYLLSHYFLSQKITI
jgi:hypothetical protein